ncbi:nitroreductase family deazaflavin-dependent oxidoreductase [Actinocorallia aurea]
MTETAKPKGIDLPRAVQIIKIMSRVNIRLYRLTGGRVGGTWRVGSAFRKPVPVCLVTVKGRKTGNPHTIPLLYLPDGENVIIVASQGGLPKNPIWYLNILANPEVTIQVRKDVRRMTARVATPVERAALWPKLVAQYADFDTYAARANREIPVVICTPA